MELLFETYFFRGTFNSNMSIVHIAHIFHLSCVLLVDMLVSVRSDQETVAGRSGALGSTVGTCPWAEHQLQLSNSYRRT